MTPDLEIEMLNEQVNLLNRTISDLMRQRNKATDRIFELRNPPPTNQMLRLAGRHISDLVMYEGHTVSDADIAALRKLIDYVSTTLGREGE
jgi:hypothetical protein